MKLSEKIQILRKRDGYSQEELDNQYLNGKPILHFQKLKN